MDPAKLKVVELRAQLSQRGLDTKGNKAVLVERLRKALEEETENESQEKSNITTEDSGDTTLKETNEIVVESSKSVQPPKTPGRSSRSSSVTPTKISTRSGPKLVLTPVSIKQSTPNKVQHIEKVSEVLTTISEIDSEEPMMDKIERDQTTPPPEKDHGKEDPAITISTQNEVHVMTDNESKETLNDSKNEKSDSQIVTSMQSSDQSSENLPKSDTMQECDNQQITSEPLEEEHIDVDNVEKKVEAVQEDAQKTYETEQVECFEKDEIELNESSQHDNENTEMETDMSDDTNKEQISVDDIATDQPSVSTAETEDKMDVDDSEHEQKVQLNESHENKDNISSEETELTETHINYVSVDEAQNTEMVEDKITKNVTDDNNRETKDSNNRKRKRSPSPVERQKSPTPIKIENEPELDDSVVTLSWYDSDLNLIINQDGFLSATPLHSDGFCYMWAGARASHGYTYGKIYYETKITELCPINVQDDEYPHALRVGWSTPQTSMQLGERKFSYAYSSTGKKCTENNFEDYGVTFSKDDIVCCYLDMTLENDIILSYSINGKYLGTAFSISKEEIGDKALYPHILSKNCSFSCNFGQEKPWSEEILEEYIPIGDLSIVDKIPGPKRPEKKEDCEIIMMCGLPASGKTVWATKHATEYPDKLYNILGINSLINKMNYMGLPRKQSYHGKWEVLIDKCTHALNKLLEMASSRRRNYILDQANIYPSAQRRKMKHFSGYQRKAVVVIPEDEEFKSRLSNHETIDGKNISDSGIMEMKANFSAPDVGESFNAVEWVELDKEEGRKLIMKYNKEGKEAGFGQQHASKRIRFDRMESNRDSRDLRNNRDTRDNRNHRDRRNNYPDRSRNPPWRGGNMGNWRDRPQRGNHMRHGGGYGGPPGGRRGRGAPIPPSHRGIDRRGGGSGDRRSNNRNRSSIRQGGRGTMSNYQGSQFNWNQQGNWSNNQPQQGGWVQEWDQQQYNWKSYNQGTYGQNNYNQQGGYGNGNWSNWNQQYYNQYWNQQQQTGQTATAAGGQATSTTAGITGTTSNSLVRYSYPQEWQEYTQAYTLPGESATTNAQQSQQHK